MADSPNSTILSRRTLMASAPGIALAALSAPAAATAERQLENDGYVPADDMLPRHREVREVVLEIERRGDQVVFCGTGIAIYYGHERAGAPIELWSRYNALDRKLLAEWLQLSGRTDPKVKTLVPGVIS